MLDDQVPPSLSVYQNFSKSVCPVNSSKPVCPANVCKLFLFVNPSKHVCSFKFSKQIRYVNYSKHIHPVDSGKPMGTVDFFYLCPINFSGFVHPVGAL